MKNVTSLFRSLWDMPRAYPPPPRRVWRDWVIVAAVVATALLEGAFRPDLPAPLLSMVTTIAVAPTLLWRRTMPLPMLAIAFFTMGVATLVIGAPIELYAGIFMLLLPYSLFRWGSLRDMVFGIIIVLINVVMTLPTNLPDALGGAAVVLLTISFGLVFRFRASGRMRELDRAKLLEREQLARDLHDTVAHHVSAIAIRAQAGLAAGAQNPAAATDALALIETEASRTLTEMRAMVKVLRRDETAELAPSPRITDLEQLAIEQDGAPTVGVHISGDTESIPPAVAAAVYRLAQESITNARRHARHATRIDVRIDGDEERVRLSVTDDGDDGPAGPPGYGITGMIERTTLLGGSFQAGRSPGRGWVVTAVLPRAEWSI